MKVRPAMAGSLSPHSRRQVTRCSTCLPGRPIVSGAGTGQERPIPATRSPSPRSSFASAEILDLRSSPSSSAHWRCSSCSGAASSATAPRRSNADWNQIDPVGEARVINLTRQRELRRLKRISFGDGLVEQVATRCIRDLARDIEDLNPRIAQLDHEIAALLAEHGNPLDDLHGAGTQIAAAVIAHAGDVRRFRSPAAFARFCGAAPIPTGSGKTAGRHRLHRGGNRQLNAALYRIAIVQARHHPPARTYLARKIAEGKTPREARRALKRHLANVIYRRLYAWADITPALNT